MKRLKQCIAFAAAAVLLLAAVPVAMAEDTAAYTIEELNLQLQLPADAIVLTPDTPLDDEAWAKAGFNAVEASQAVDEYKAVGVVAEIVTSATTNSLRMIKATTDTTESIYTFNDYSPQELEEYFNNLAEVDDKHITATCTPYLHEQTTFFKMDTTAVTDGEEINSQRIIRELVWGTIINGYTAAFSLYAPSEDLTHEEVPYSDDGLTDEQLAYAQALIPEEDIAFVEGLIDSATFTEVLARPVKTYSTLEIALALGFIIGLIVLMAGFLGWSIHRRHKLKADAKLYAEQITNYRKAQQANPQQHEVAALFINHTEHNDAAIQTFARYQAYFHHPFNIVYYVLVSLVGLLICLLSQDDWWILLLLLLVFGYCIYYVVNLPTKIGGRIREVFRKLPNRTAVFTFFDTDFRLSGLQAPSLYPYAQITEAREHGDYFYLYFGEETTYYLRKDQFTLGTPEEFSTFLRGKLGKRFKGRRPRR